jgi:hypothetical protein
MEYICAYQRYGRLYIYIYIHTYTHTYVHTRGRAGSAHRERARASERERERERACERERERARERVRERERASKRERASERERERARASERERERVHVCIPGASQGEHTQQWCRPLRRPTPCPCLYQDSKSNPMNITFECTHTHSDPSLKYPIGGNLWKIKIISIVVTLCPCLGCPPRGKLGKTRCLRSALRATNHCARGPSTKT